MTASTVNRPIPNKSQQVSFLPLVQRYPVEASTNLLGGVMVALNAANNVQDAGTAGGRFIVGVTRQQYPNIAGNPYATTNGAAGGIVAEVMQGVFPFFQTGTTITNAHIGFPCYAADNQTVSLAASAGPFAGYVYGIDTNPQTLGQVLVLFASPLEAFPTVQKITIDVPLTAIQAATSGTAFNIGAVLPVGAFVIGTDINVIQVIAGGTIASAVAKVQNTGETAGALLGGGSGVNVFTGVTPGLFATPVGSNPFGNRGGQQLQMTITTGTDTPNHATTGHLAVDLFIAITG